MKEILKRFIQIWIVVYVLAVLIPASSIYSIESQFYALGIIAIFLFILSLSSIFSVSLFLSKFKNNESILFEKELIVNEILIYKIIKICSFLCLLGLLFFIYDKAFIQGVNYLDGLAVARSNFRDIGENRNGVSSIYSVLGYVLSGFSCISLLLSFIFYEFNVKISSFGILIPIINLMGVSFLTGGRTSIILIVIVIISGRSIRKLIGYNSWPFTKKKTIIFNLLSLLMFFYIIYIFADRAQSNNVSVKNYTESMIEYLSGEPTVNFEKIEVFPEPFQSFTYLLLSLITYFVHGTWITEGIFEVSVKYGNATFLGFGDYLAKIGLPTKLDEWIFSGKFVTWPGAIYHDLGLIGILIIPLIHGILFGYCSYKIHHRKELTISVLFLFFFNFSIMMTSPFICVIDLLMFTPICLAFITVIIVMTLKKNKKTTYLVTYK